MNLFQIRFFFTKLNTKRTETSKDYKNMKILIPYSRKYILNYNNI